MSSFAEKETNAGDGKKAAVNWAANDDSSDEESEAEEEEGIRVGIFCTESYRNVLLNV
jgi:hypothetical protein